jgi:hypothetical protein
MLVAGGVPPAPAQRHQAWRERRNRRRRLRSGEGPSDGTGKGSRVGRGTTASWRLGRRGAGVPASGRGRGVSAAYAGDDEGVLLEVPESELPDEPELPEVPESPEVLLSLPDVPELSEPDPEPEELEVDEPERLSVL